MTSPSSGWAKRAQVGKRLSTLLADLLGGAERSSIVRRLRRLADDLEGGLEDKAPAPEHPLAAELVAYWKKAVSKPRAKATPERIAKIKARLADGYSPDEIRRAIDGAATSEFHMGKNDAGKEYCDLTLICRNGSKLEEFRDMAGDAAPDRYDGVPAVVVDRMQEIEREAEVALSEGKVDDYNSAHIRLHKLAKAHGVGNRAARDREAS